MSEIKAIQTEYKGYLFRSRLEARWAVFFDALGVRYEYEKEGFDLDGLWYLPDFWLPTLRAWIEIKADLPEGDDAEKLFRFSDALDADPDHTLIEKHVDFYLMVGTPFADGWEKDYQIRRPHGKTFFDAQELWMHCPVCGGVSVASGWDEYSHELNGQLWDGMGCMDCDIGSPSHQTDYRVAGAYFHKGLITCPPGTANASPLLRAAYRAARSARFEHGHKGRTL